MPAEGSSFGFRPGRPDEVTNGGNQRIDANAQLLIGGAGFFPQDTGFFPQALVGSTGLFGEASDRGVRFGDLNGQFVDLPLGIAPELAILLPVFAALLG